MAIYAISYDPVETLSRFSQAHGITYPLLADVGSEVMADLGILNVTVAEERAAYNRPIEDRHTGIPYPGTFFLDTDGVVVAKRFEQSHRIRPAANTLLRELGGVDSGPPPSSAEGNSPGVRVAAWLDTDTLAANQLQDVNVRIQVDDDVHLYTDPVPDGFRALRISASGDERLRSREVEMPEGKPFSVEGLPETFSVLEGQLDLTLPFFLVSNRDTAGDDVRPVALSVVVEYQACTSSECFMPERLTLELPLSEVPNPGYETADPGAVSPLALRRLVEGPKGEPELLDLVNAALAGTEITAATLRGILDDLQANGIVDLEPSGLWRSL